MAVPTKLISTSIGFQDSSGAFVNAGFLRLQLSQPAEITSGGGLVTTQPLFLQLTAGGKITSQAIWFNDELTPSGTLYSAQLYDSNGLTLLQDFGYWSIAGASADLSTTVPVSVGISSAGAVLLNPAAQQNINGQTLNMEGAPLSFSAPASTTADSFISRISAGLLAIGVSNGDGSGQLNMGTLQAGTLAKVGNGTVGAPSLTFISDPTTGVYRVAASRIGISLAGANAVDLQTTIAIFNNGSVKTNVFIVSIANPDVGLSRFAAGTLAVGNGTAADTTGSLAFTNAAMLGKATTYNNIATADFGLSPIVGTPVHLTGQTSNLGATNIYAAPVTGMYKLFFQARTTTSGTGTTATATFAWADEGGAKSFTTGTWALNSVTFTGTTSGTLPIHINSGTAVQLSVTGTFGTSVYAIDAWLERVT